MNALGTATILRADARQLPLADGSVDAIVCDPPYALPGGFMGRSWDRFDEPRAFQEWCEVWAREAYRVLKPGAFLIAFGGTRTWHRMVCAIEDAGFEIRDSIGHGHMAWTYGQGFAKGLDVAKAIDAAAGAEREVVGASPFASRKPNGTWTGDIYGDEPSHAAGPTVTAPATDDARRWQGWNTSLKPAWEPIAVARKPLVGTVVDNVLQFGTGALNIDGCRIPAGQDYADKCASVVGLASNRNGDAYGEWTGTRTDSTHPAGRWPTNVVMSHPPLLDEHGEIIGDACADGCVAGCPVAELDAQSGVTKASASPLRRNTALGVMNDDAWQPKATEGVRYAGEGGASRFFPTFRYEAKAPADERPRVDGVAHPTVKPLELIRWLCRLVTPPGGRVLDMFGGSGTTGEAALLEGFNVVVSENDADYLRLIQYRIDRAHRRLQPGVARLAKAKPTAQTDGQGDLFADLFGGAA